MGMRQHTVTPDRAVRQRQSGREGRIGVELWELCTASRTVSPDGMGGGEGRRNFGDWILSRQRREEEGTLGTGLSASADTGSVEPVKV
ncbi:hypothetical protein E2C01_008702 [Portunus trituberculatus]|uniref:Uncharacterized protein n=1 Tax=Portunus trituberculatus TaxID=210409 RepID=A0A5B7D2N9_PORTR|nr:hypothetical protein [Portunus trituberculatus]